MKSRPELTRLLIELKNGTESAFDELFPLVYEELKQIALSKLSSECQSHPFSKTALVHEIYLKMVDQKHLAANDKNHFLAIAARCMRQVLIDYAREKNAEKRGGDLQDKTYKDELFHKQHKADKLLDINQKLDELSELDKRLSDVVELRIFGNMTITATADAMGLSESTVKRDWAKARSWLHKELK